MVFDKKGKFISISWLDFSQFEKIADFTGDQIKSAGLGQFEN